MNVDFQQIQEDVISIKEMLIIINDRLNQPVSIVPPSDEVLNVQQAAKLLNLTTATVYGMVYEKRIPYNKPNGRLYFLRSELLTWVKDARKPTTDDLDDQARQVMTERLGRRNQSKIRKGGRNVV